MARPAMTAVGQWISAATVLRWSFEGTGRILNVGNLTPSPATNPVLQQYGDAFSRDPVQNWLILAAFCAAAFALTCLALARKSAR